MKHETKTRTRVSHVVNVCTEDIIKWLARKEGLSREAKASVTVQVPSGGDYSGDVLDLDEVGGLTVTWEETVENDDGR